MTTDAPFDVGVALCKALDLDPLDTYRIEIIAEPGKSLTVRASQWQRDEQLRLVAVGEGDARRIASVIKTWHEQAGEPVVENPDAA